MEMNELFYQNSYQTSFDADVVSCEEVKGNYHIILSDTCFYPEGGGQPCDLGTLDDAEVIDVRRKGNAVIHVVRKPLAGRVHGEINWQRRFDHMHLSKAVLGKTQCLSVKEGTGIQKVLDDILPEG